MNKSRAISESKENIFPFNPPQLNPPINTSRCSLHCVYIAIPFHIETERRTTDTSKNDASIHRYSLAFHFQLQVSSNSVKFNNLTITPSGANRAKKVGCDSCHDIKWNRWKCKGMEEGRGPGVLKVSARFPLESRGGLNRLAVA